MSEVSIEYLKRQKDIIDLLGIAKNTFLKFVKEQNIEPYWLGGSKFFDIREILSKMKGYKGYDLSDC